MVPTRLYIKRHSVTGLMYFGKTTRINVETYSGSGLYWTRHLKEHGDDLIENVWISDVFTDEHQIKEFSEFFSEFFDIVNSPEWANLKPETGLDGGFPKNGHTVESKQKMSQSKKGKPKSEDHKQKLREARARQIISEETRRKMSATRTGKKHSAETRAKMKIAQQRIAAEKLKNKLLNE